MTEALTLSLDPAQSAGLLLAITRVAAFAIAVAPISAVLPMPARAALSVALGWFLAEPYEGSLSPYALLSAAAINAGLGAALGWMAGVILQVFFTAGAWLDIQSGLFAAVLIDPTMGDRAGIYARFFNWIGFALFYTVGGLEVLVRGLDASFSLVAADGAMAFDPARLAETALDLVARVMLGGLELALPVAAALFLTEVGLGLASRFSPQTNVFMLGLPAKLLISLSLVSVTVMLFPEAMGGALDAMEHAMAEVIRAFMP